MSVEIPCAFEGVPHTYPSDWQFGGANGKHPGADPRWKPSTYIYYDKDATEVWRTQVYLCDDEALNGFTRVAEIVGASPHWIAVERPGGKSEMLPWVYDKASDTYYPREV